MRKMRIWKRTLALLLVLALGVTLAGCGSFEARMTKAAVKMSKAKSAHMDMDLKMGVTLTLLGQDVPMDISGTMALDVQKKPAVSKGEVTVGMLDVEEQVLYYAEQAGGETVTYLSQDGGESWTKESSSAGESKSGGGLAALKLLSDVADSFEEAGEENVDGAAAWRYDGILEGAFLAKLLEQSGTGETLEQTMQGMLSVEDLQGSESIQVSIWIDKSAGTISRMDLDLSELLDVMAVRITKNIVEETGLGRSAVNLSVSSATISVRLSQIDQVGSIQVPDEVRAAAG